MGVETDPASVASVAPSSVAVVATKTTADLEVGVVVCTMAEAEVDAEPDVTGEGPYIVVVLVVKVTDVAVSTNVIT